MVAFVVDGFLLAGHARFQQRLAGLIKGCWLEIKWCSGELDICCLGFFQCFLRSWCSTQCYSLTLGRDRRMLCRWIATVFKWEPLLLKSRPLSDNTSARVPSMVNMSDRRAITVGTLSWLGFSEEWIHIEVVTVYQSAFTVLLKEDSTFFLQWSLGEPNVEKGLRRQRRFCFEVNLAPLDEDLNVAI